MSLTIVNEVIMPIVNLVMLY